MFRRFAMIAVLAAGCTSSPEPTADQQELEECFGAHAPGVPESAAAGRGFTADEMRTALFGPDPAAEPVAPGESDPQLAAFVDVFAGLTRADYKALERELDFLDGFFSTTATSVALAPRLAAAATAAKKVPAHLRLAPSAIAGAYRTASLAPCRTITRSAGKLTLSIACGDVSGAIVFAGSATVLDAVDALIRGELDNFSISSPLRETLTISFDHLAVTSPQGDRQTVVQGVVSAAFDMSEFTITIDETTDDTNVKVLGTLDISADAIMLTSVDPLSSAVKETGTVSTQVKAVFNVNAVNTFDRNQQLDGAGTTQSSLIVSDSSAVIDVESFAFSMGDNRVTAAGKLAVGASAEGDEAHASDEKGQLGSTSRLALAISASLKGATATVENAKGKLQLDLGGKGSARIGQHQVSEGRSDLDTGEHVEDESSQAFRLACGYANLAVDHAEGGSNRLGIRVHALAGSEAHGQSDTRYVTQPDFEESFFDEGGQTLYLKQLVFNVDLLGKTARGAVPRWVTHEQHGSRSETSSRYGYSNAYDSASTTITTIDPAGYVGFGGHPYVFKTAPDTNVTEREHYYYAESVGDDHKLDPQASGVFQLVSGDVFEMAMVRKETPEPHLQAQYSLNGTVLVPYEPWVEGPGLPNDPLFLLKY